MKKYKYYIFISKVIDIIICMCLYEFLINTILRINLNFNKIKFLVYF